MIRICALEENLTLDASLSRWSKRTLTWCITGTLPRVSEEDEQAVYAKAWSLWAKVANIIPVYTTNARTADVRMGAGQIDGPLGTLAQSQLPNGTNSPLWQTYDTAEAWSPAMSKAQWPSGTIPLLITATHELGHVLGLGHSQDKNAVMFWQLNTNAWEPQTDDIREIQARYGPPVAPPAPAPTPVPPAGSLTGDQAMAQVEALVAQWRVGR